MANESTTTSTESIDAQPIIAAGQPGFFQKLTALFQTPKKTGVSCIHCEWTGPASAVFKAPRLNEDGKVYMISACPRCMRNGGLEFYD